MRSLIYIALFLFSIGSSFVFAQKKPKKVQEILVADTITVKVNPLAPAKAAFYSAILPGLGQAYNRSYWKIPIVYAALGTTIYFYVTNDNKYNTFRDVYKRRLEGFKDDEYQYLDNDRLVSAQKFYQNNRDLSALLTSLFYVLNIVDANVDAHLSQFNVNDKLTIKPDLYRNDLTRRQNVGIVLTYNF